MGFEVIECGKGGSGGRWGSAEWDFQGQVVRGRPRLKKDLRKWECARARANLKERDLKVLMVERSIVERTRKSMTGNEVRNRLSKHRYIMRIGNMENDNTKSRNGNLSPLHLPLSQPLGGTFQKLSHDAIFAMCSHTFALSSD